MQRVVPKFFKVHPATGLIPNRWGYKVWVMDSNRLIYFVFIILASNLLVATLSGVLCYNAGWQEAFEFCTAAHVQAIKDMQAKP